MTKKMNNPTYLDKIKDTLPKKPSDLILLALKDLEKAEKTPNVKIQMDNHWLAKMNEVCEVCFAGSVMLGTCGINPENMIDGDGDNLGILWNVEFCDSLTLKFIALDHFRLGKIVHGLEFMGLKKLADYLPSMMRVTPYKKDKVQFKKDMRKLAAMLKAEKL